MDDEKKEQCVVCRRMFVRGRGLKIHQAKSGCKERMTASHRRLCKSEANSTQELHHSDADGHVELSESRSNSTTREEVRERKRDGEVKDKEGSDRKLSKPERKEGKESHNRGSKKIKKNSRKNKVLKEKENFQISDNGKRSKKEINKVDGRKEDILKLGKKEIFNNKEEKPNKVIVKKIEELLEHMRKKSDKDMLSKRGKEVAKDHNKTSKRIKMVNGDIRTWVGKGPVKRVEHGSKSNLSKLAMKEKERKDIKESINIMGGPANEVLVKKNLWLTRTDFRSLAGSNYLNDKIIDEYLTLIQQRNTDDQTLPKIATFTVFLYQKLERLGLEEGYRDTEAWIKEDIRNKDLIFFPIHKNHHWSLIVVDTKGKTVQYLDSIRGSRKVSSAPRIIKKYIEKYYKEKGEAATFKIIIREDIPCQTNGVDCGVFLCQYAERLARQAPIDFRQEDMAEIRAKMAEELLKSELHIASGGILSAQTTKKIERKNVNEEMKEIKEKDTKKNTNRNEKKAGRKGKKNCTSRKPEGQEVKYLIEKVNKDTKRGSKKKSPADSKPSQKTTDLKEEDKGSYAEDKRRERINWPKANSLEWLKLDEDLTSILRTWHSSPEEKAESHPRLIYAFSRERYGVKKQMRKLPQSAGPSRRQQKGMRLRQEINKLKKAYEQAPSKEEKSAINQLQQEKLKELRLAKRAETIRQNRRKFSRNCNEFLGQPFEFARKTIAPKPRGEMKSDKHEVQEHLRKTHSDPKREEKRSIQKDLWVYQKPLIEFNNELPTWSEFSRRLRKTRSKSAPGPNGVPYLVYKRCPGVARLLWQYLRGIWRKNGISKSWRKAEGVFIPKEDGATTVEKFRTISLLNVEGKLYFAMKADRLLEFTLTNEYIDTTIQKGGVPAVSGCLEHTAVLSQLIREAKAEKRNLVVTWLDIANAYGSIPHSLIQIALNRAHVPESMCSLVESYYNDIKIRFTTGLYTTEWQRVEKGIITGCTMSVVLFSLAMTMLVVSAKEETKGPIMSSGLRQINSRLFMDDIATTTETLVQTKYLLEKLNEKLNWARLTIKPEKCRSLVIIKGKISKRTPEINGRPITSITEKPVKYLGKSYNMSLNEQQQIEEAMKQVKDELKKIQNCKIPGRYKAWILQHMLLPRLMWPLSIYNVPVTKVEEIQRWITSSLKRWLGIPKSLSVDCLYNKSGKLQLPFTALTEEVKVAKARNLVTLRESSDPCVKGAEIKVDGGRKANTPADVEEAKSKLRMKEITGIGNKGREGLGLNPRQYYSSCSKEGKRSMIMSTIRETEEERRRIRMAGLAKQGASTRWEVPERKLTHRDIINTSEANFKFLIKSVYDLLPTPANKNMWYNTNESCKLCGGAATLNHILSACEVALAQGRYRWRHDQVLQELAYCLEEKRKSSNSKPNVNRRKIEFVREGERKNSVRMYDPDSYMDTAQDWKLEVDLWGRLKVPSYVMETNLRPDILLISEATKQMGVIELTVPSEERIEISGELKKTKYAILEEEGRQRGWKVRVWAVEVGCRGFPAASMTTLLKNMGYKGSQRKALLRKISSAAELASQSIWKWSHFKEWGRGKKP